MRQSARAEAYAAALAQLSDLGLTYHCTCTRGDIKAALSAPQEGAPVMGPDGPIYPGTCRGKGHSAGVLRLDMAAAMARLGEIRFSETGTRAGAHLYSASDMVESVGDIVLARRDIGTSYHIAVVVDDAAQGITEVTRGEDLFEATAIHVVLQRLLDLPTPAYHHHRLIRDDQGKRLAKRDDAPVRVKDVAQVAIGKQLRTGAATQDGQEVVLGTVMMLLGQNSRTVSQDVALKLADINQRLPKGVQTEISYNREVLVDKTIDTVKRNLFEGAVLVIVVLFLFLGNIRAAMTANPSAQEFAPGLFIRGFAPPLRLRDYRLVAFDMRGYGRSHIPLADFIWSLDLLVDDLFAVADAAGIDEGLVPAQAQGVAQRVGGGRGVGSGACLCGPGGQLGRRPCHRSAGHRRPGTQARAHRRHAGRCLMRCAMGRRSRQARALRIRNGPIHRRFGIHPRHDQRLRPWRQRFVMIRGCRAQNCQAGSCNIAPIVDNAM